jgi:hypothetical protein
MRTIEDEFTKLCEEFAVAWPVPPPDDGSVASLEQAVELTASALGLLVDHHGYLHAIDVCDVLSHYFPQLLDHPGKRTRALVVLIQEKPELRLSAAKFGEMLERTFGSYDLKVSRGQRSTDENTYIIFRSSDQLKAYLTPRAKRVQQNVLYIAIEKEFAKENALTMASPERGNGA